MQVLYIELQQGNEHIINYDLQIRYLAIFLFYVK
jgi:hypothetical protein